VIADDQQRATIDEALARIQEAYPSPHLARTAEAVRHHGEVSGQPARSLGAIPGEALAQVGTDRALYSDYAKRPWS
jgi:hypothetical protein